MPPPETEEVVTVLLIPMLLLAAQLPVWVLRAAMGCRLAVGIAGEAEAPGDARQFRVGDLLVVTAVVALCLGLAQLGIRLASPSESDGALVLGITCCVLALVSAVVLLPGIWAALIVRSKALGAAVYFGLAGATCLAIVMIGAILTRRSPPPGEILEIVGYVACLLLFLLVLAGSVLGSLHVFRACGLVLVWPKRKPRTEPQTEAEREPGSPFQGDGPEEVIEEEGA
jgi:hypothetical protein